MRRFMLVVGVAVLVAVAGCGGGGGSSSSSGSSTTTSQVVITGTIVSDQSGHPVVAGVKITFGTLTASSGQDGTFKITLPTGTTLLTLFPSQSGYFSVDTSGITNFPTTRYVTYNGATYPQNQIPVPASVMAGTSTSLGTIQVGYLNPNDSSNPPGPPDYSDSGGNSTGGSGNPTDSSGNGGGSGPPPPPV